MTRHSIAWVGVLLIFVVGANAAVEIACNWKGTAKTFDECLKRSKTAKGPHKCIFCTKGKEVRCHGCRMWANMKTSGFKCEETEGQGTCPNSPTAKNETKTPAPTPKPKPKPAPKEDAKPPPSTSTQPKNDTKPTPPPDPAPKDPDPAPAPAPTEPEPPADSPPADDPPADDPAPATEEPAGPPQYWLPPPSDTPPSLGALEPGLVPGMQALAKSGKTSLLGPDVTYYNPRFIYGQYYAAPDPGSAGLPPP